MDANNEPRRPTAAERDSADEAPLRERLEEESPDGRPPTRMVRQRSRVVLATGLIVAVTGTLIGLYVWGGALPALLAAVLFLLFVAFAAWPAWHAAADRQVDRAQAQREIRGDLGGGAAGRPR